jgi:hypothetical protein
MTTDARPVWIGSEMLDHVITSDEAGHCVGHDRATQCARAVVERGAMMRALLLLGLLIGCGGDVDDADNQPLDCPCGSPLTPYAMTRYGSFEEQLAEFSALACNIAGTSFWGECSDGKTLLYVNGGLGHTALYYVGNQLVGTSTSSDVISGDCPTSHYQGALQNVTCDLLSKELLCPDNRYSGLLDFPVPFADGQLSPWCGE